MKHEVSTLTYKRTLGELLKLHSFQAKYRRGKWPKDCWVEFNSMSDVLRLKKGAVHPRGTLYGIYYKEGKIQWEFKSHVSAINFMEYIG